MPDGDQHSEVSALYRLKRAGDETSAANRKLAAAARVIADLVCEIVDPGVVLPDGYAVRLRGGRPFLVLAGSTPARDCWINGDGTGAPLPSVAGVRQFADDIARDWLRAVARTIEQLRDADLERAAMLAAAADALNRLPAAE